MSEDDPKAAARRARSHPTTEGLLRQFLNHDGPKGTSPAFQRGHDFAFAFDDDQRARVNKLMTYGMPFEDAFDQVKREDRTKVALNELEELTESYGGYNALKDPDADS